jgi:hypothetical protein
MDSRKILYSVLVIISTIIIVILFWKNYALLGILLVTLGFVKHKIMPIKIEFLWFVVSAIVGTAGESLIIMGGPWTYSVVNILNFPLWLPFLWGVAGITAISLYEGITGSK